MRSAVFTGLCIFFFAACQKSGSSPTARIQYKIDGVQVTINGDQDMSNRGSSTGAWYGCFVTKPGGSNFYSITGVDKNSEILFVINTPNDSLSVKTYDGGDVDVSFSVNGSVYGINNGDQMLIHISRYSGGTIDGTFSGTVSDANSNRKTITEGSVSNLRVYY